MFPSLLAGSIVAILGIKWVGVDPTAAMMCGLLVAYIVWPRDRRR